MKNGHHSGDSNPRPLGHEYLALTTRPRLLASLQVRLFTWICCCSKTGGGLQSETDRNPYWPIWTGQNMDGLRESQWENKVPSRTVSKPPPMKPSRVFLGLSWRTKLKVLNVLTKRSGWFLIGRCPYFICKTDFNYISIVIKKWQKESLKKKDFKEKMWFFCGFFT